MTRASRTGTVLAGVAVLLAAPLTDAAHAQFRDATSVDGLPVSTAQLAPATDLAAAAGCALLTHKVDLQWTASASTFAAGYRVYRRPSTDSTYSLVADVAGRTTSTYTDTTVAASTSYVYVVDAYRGGWSARSSTASATTRSVCLL